jgi:general secretion pathway protein B
MSFILDALKKSESERQRQSVPGLMDARLARPRRRLPVWALAICGLLGLNVVVLVVVLLRHGTPAPATPRAAAHTEAAAPPVNSPPSAAASAHFSPLDAAPVYAPEIPVVEGGGDATATGAVDNAGPARAARHRAEPVLRAADTRAENDEVLPEISELSLSGPQALPELHLDVHVFATNAADRFVYINMRKYREGAVLPEGPTLERIRRDGVVLNYQGLRFLLPRQ